MPISFATLGPQNKLIIMEKCPEKSIFFFHWSVLLWGRNKGPRTSFTLSTPSAKKLGFFNCGPHLYISILCNDQPDLAYTRKPFWNELRSFSKETYILHMRCATLVIPSPVTPCLQSAARHFRTSATTVWPDIWNAKRGKKRRTWTWCTVYGIVTFVQKGLKLNA